MDLGIFINELADAIGSNKGIASILDNPIYAAILMTLIVMIIFYFAKPEMRIRTSFYIFCSLLAILFVYHRRFQKQNKTGGRISEIRSALANPPAMANTDLVPIISPVYMTSTPSGLV